MDTSGGETDGDTEHGDEDENHEVAAPEISQNHQVISYSVSKEIANPHYYLAFATRTIVIIFNRLSSCYNLGIHANAISEYPIFRSIYP
jgi:hypothetical protein